MAHPTNQKQAFRPVPERVSFIVEWAKEPARKRLIDNGAKSHIKSALHRPDKVESSCQQI